MEILLFIAIFYFVYKAISKNNSSAPSSSDSTGVQKTSNHDTTINISSYWSYMNALRRQYEQNGDSILQNTNIQAFINEYDLNKRYHINSDDVKQDILSIINKIKKEKADWKKNYQTYLEALKQYYLLYGEEAFNPSNIHDFIDSNQLESKFGFKFTDVVNNLCNIEVQVKNTPGIPLVQSQSILNEQQIFNHIKAMPVKWEFGSPDVLENESLKKLCSNFINSKPVLSVLNPEAFKNMELVIQQKRTRTPRKAEYNTIMERNMLYELYKYSYLMNIFQVLKNKENEMLKVDHAKLWNMIQKDCHKRIENFEQEKRNNPAIRNMFQKYEYDTQKIKMVINGYVEPREYDYIYAASMTNALLAIVFDCVLNGEIDTGNGYQKTLHAVRQYPASDIMAAVDASVNSIVNLSLGLYTNGGKLPRT